MLVLTALLLASEPASPQLLPPEETVARTYEGWSREQLVAERDRLQGERPGLGLPIGLISAGAPAFGVSVVAILLAYANAWFLNNSSLFGGGAQHEVSTPYLVTFVALGITGIASAVTGLILLRSITAKRQEYEPTLAVLDEQIERADPQATTPATELAPPPP